MKNFHRFAKLVVDQFLQLPKEKQELATLSADEIRAQLNALA